MTSSRPLPPDELLSMQDIADMAGISLGLVRWHKWAGHLPDPDRYVGRSPAWRWATIRGWVEARLRG